MKAIYRADDGREFESEDECREYEQSLQSRFVRMFDKDGEETHDYDAASFIANTMQLTTDEFERMRNNLKYCGAAGYSHLAGIYVWVSNQCFWLPFQDCYTLRKILDVIRK